jgi:hypothetical protein
MWIENIYDALGEVAFICNFSYSFAHININSVGNIGTMVLKKSKIIFGGM